MIEIDKISFRFTAHDETFANNLYANWDEFCTNCFEKVVDEYFSAYDKEGVVTEINLMELNLGNIPQEQFHQLFPIRLREELERCLRLTFMESKEREVSVEHKSESLWHYLKYGISRAVFENPTFRLDDELSSMICDDKEAVADLFQKVLTERTSLNRLLLQTNKATFVKVLAAWLESNSIDVNDKRKVLLLSAIQVPVLLWQVIGKIADNKSLKNQIILMSGIYFGSDTQFSHMSEINNNYPNLNQLQASIDGDEYFTWLTDLALALSEKKRCLAYFIDRAFSKLQLFILKTEDNQKLLALADLIDDIMIPKIISGIYVHNTPTEIVLYWTWLYGWLTEHYHSIGFTSFGNQQLFQHRLNFSLLHTLRINDSSVFASKSDLTAYFLNNLFVSEAENEIQIISDYIEAEKVTLEIENLFDLYQAINIKFLESRKGELNNDTTSISNDEEGINTAFLTRISSLSEPTSQNDGSLQAVNLESYNENFSATESDLLIERHFQTEKEFLDWIIDKQIPTELKTKQLSKFAVNNPKLFHSLVRIIDADSILYNYLEKVFPQRLAPPSNTTAVQEFAPEAISLSDKIRRILTGNEVNMVLANPKIEEINHTKQNASGFSETESIDPLENSITTPVSTSITQPDKEFVNLITDENIIKEQKVKLINDLSIINSEQFCCLLGEMDTDSAFFDQLANTTSQSMLIRWFASLSVAKAELLLQVLELLNKSENIPIVNITEKLNKVLLLLLHEKSKSLNEFISEDDEMYIIIEKYTR